MAQFEWITSAEQLSDKEWEQLTGESDDVNSIKVAQNGGILTTAGVVLGAALILSQSTMDVPHLSADDMLFQQSTGSDFVSIEQKVVSHGKWPYGSSIYHNSSQSDRELRRLRNQDD